MELKKIQSELKVLKQKEKVLKQKEKDLKRKLWKIELEKRVKGSIHHLVTDYNSGKQESVCGAKLIPQDKKSKDFGFDEFKNATIYFDNAKNKCPVCSLNDRVAGDDCPKCGVFFDTPKDTYCGNCGKITAKRRKLKYPAYREQKEYKGQEGYKEKVCANCGCNLVKIKGKYKHEHEGIYGKGCGTYFIDGKGACLCKKPVPRSGKHSLGIWY